MGKRQPEFSALCGTENSFQGLTHLLKPAAAEVRLQLPSSDGFELLHLQGTMKCFLLDTVLFLFLFF